MATNYTKEIIDQFVDQIQSEYLRFKDRNRVQRVKNFDDLNLANIGYDDSIFIHPLSIDTTQQLTAGAFADYPLEFLYIKKSYKDQLDDVSAFAEALEEFFRSITHNGEYWYNLRTQIDYDIESYLPEILSDLDNKNFGGFLMTVTVNRYKSGSATRRYGLEDIYIWRNVQLSNTLSEQTLTTGSGELTLAKLDSGQVALPTFSAPVTVQIVSKRQERGCKKTTVETISSGNVTFGLTLDEIGNNYSDGYCYYDISIIALGN